MDRQDRAGLAGVVVERRENLLEDQSELNLAKAGKASGPAVFNYYLGWLTNKKVTHHMPAADYGLNLAYAKQWGMDVAVQDLRRVIAAAHKLGGKVVLGGHSLGGSVVTAYATWDFNGKPGADGLAGLVYIDGGSFRNITATQAQSDLSQLDAAKASPWLSFGGIGAPFAGLFIDTGALGIFLNPNAPSKARRSSTSRRSEAEGTGDQRSSVRLRAQRRYFPGHARRGASPSGQGHLIDHHRRLSHLERRRRVDTDQALRADVLRVGYPERRRRRVVLPAATHR